MKRRLLVPAMVLLSLVSAFLPGVAGGAPTPVYGATCAVGGSTTASWQRVKLVRVTLEWSAAPGSSTSFQDVTAPLTPTPPRGSILTTTPSSNGVNPATMTALFQRADGTTDQTTVACS